MKRIIIILLALGVTLYSPAQTKNSTVKKNTARTTVTTKRKTTAKSKSTTTKYSNSSIRGLQSQRAQIQKKIKQQEQALRANQTAVKKRLQDLMVINSAIGERQKSIDGIEKDITQINGNLGILKAQLKTLEQQLAERKAKYVKSMRYMARHHSFQDQLMFIFSSKNFAQMYRRLRFIREYSTYQRAQGEMVKVKQSQVNDKHTQLENVRGQKNTLLYKGKQERSQLEGQQNEQQKIVSNLQNQQKTIEKVISEQRKKDAALNSQIDRLVAVEVAKAQARAAAEAKKRAASAAAAKKRAAELAAKKAAAAAAARENARRVAEAKEREEKMKAAALAADEAAENAKKQKDVEIAAERKARADQAAREARADREAAERKEKMDAARSVKEIAEAKKDANEALTMSSVDRMVSGGFEANRGRLPMPITGGYRIVSHFGQYNVEGLKNVRLDNKGINILGGSGCAARSIYDGEVGAVFGFGGTMVVMVRHGAYISVYCNLKSVSVHTGQHVSTRQVLGTVGVDNILQFQLRRGTAKLNPEAWLGR